MSHVAFVAAGICALPGLVFLLIARGAARRRRWQRMLLGGLAGLLFLTLATLCATVGVSIRGYRALTREEVAATVRTFPIGSQRFRARVSFPDGREEIFDLAGDTVYVDAHILKWRSWVNLLGVHTLYELDRLAGRYDGLADERGKPRTVFTLGRTKPFDLFDVVRRFGRLSALLDAEYGSATFVGARGVAAYEILVSTSGLLARPLGETRASPARHWFGRLAHRRSKLQFTSWAIRWGWSTGNCIPTTSGGNVDSPILRVRRRAGDEARRPLRG